MNPVNPVTIIYNITPVQIKHYSLFWIETVVLLVGLNWVVPFRVEAVVGEPFEHLLLVLGAELLDIPDEHEEVETCRTAHDRVAVLLYAVVLSELSQPDNPV